jgi:hypothetical protein
MKAFIAIAFTLQAAVASANCFENTRCVPFNAATDSDASALELRQRGTACLDAAEDLRARKGTRHACFRPLDSMGISFFNKASVAEYSQWETEQQASQAAYQAEQEAYEREQAQYQLEMQRYNRERAEWERQCAAYRAATGLECR